MQAQVSRRHFIIPQLHSTFSIKTKQFNYSVIYTYEGLFCEDNSIACERVSDVIKGGIVYQLKSSCNRMRFRINKFLEVIVGVTVHALKMESMCYQCGNNEIALE